MWTTCTLKVQGALLEYQAYPVGGYRSALPFREGPPHFASHNIELVKVPDLGDFPLSHKRTREAPHCSESLSVGGTGFLRHELSYVTMNHAALQTRSFRRSAFLEERFGTGFLPWHKLNSKNTRVRHDKDNK